MRQHAAEAVSKRAHKSRAAKARLRERPTTASAHVGNGKATPQNLVIYCFDTASATSSRSLGCRDWRYASGLIGIQTLTLGHLNASTGARNFSPHRNPLGGNSGSSLPCSQWFVFRDDNTSFVVVVSPRRGKIFSTLC
jgi:hypothetical protein